MSGKTGIGWTDYTWNPVVGCDKVSPGCKLCYAKTSHDLRHKAFLEGKKVAPQYRLPFEQVQLKPERLSWPLSLRRPSRIFVNSVSDLFHEDVPDDFIDRVFTVMGQAHRHTFQILTKRPARMLEYFRGVEAEGDRIDGGPWKLQPYPNVWLGVSVENQAAADERIPLLLQTPAAVRFLSCEPLLGPINLFAWLCEDASPVYQRLSRWYGPDGFDPKGLQPERTWKIRVPPPIQWIIAGGESGSSKQNPRPMDAAWARMLRDQCRAAGVPFFFKQWGDYLTFDAQSPCLRTDGVEHFARVDGHNYRGDRIRFWTESGAYDRDARWAVRVGTQRAGRQLDGVEHSAFP